MGDRKQIQTSLSFDMRSPAFGAQPAEIYPQALDMAEYADGIGVNSISLMEHHGADDNYLPQPFVLAAGIAARTKRCRIAIGAVQLPLHDPVHIAEKIAVLDLMSQGRARITLGAGRLPDEFAMFGKSLKDRARLMDEGLEIILRALHGERFTYNGRPIFVRPLPVQQPEDIIMIGGGVEASAKRAAKFDVGFQPMRPDLLPIYIEECERLGRKPRQMGNPGGLMNVQLTEDIEAGWQTLAPHIQHMAGAQTRYNAKEPNSPYHGIGDDLEQLKQSRMFNVMTPEDLVRRAPAEVKPGAGAMLSPLIAGVDPAFGWNSLKLLGGVIDRLKYPETTEA
ncbi:MAG TPA: LLM class flavin-dependent oxidoreductase [Novosphingobium sp.]|nr:LLM class flavin-dependent oxidoreductase [Novosphingobium sp.]